ncbi:ATP-binding protein [Oligoflexia bacterium]|nr:ATP-binding protein [Oligoflexia bacterium]
MKLLGSLSLKRKLTLFFWLACGASLICTYLGFAITDLIYFKHSFTQELTSIARVVGNNSRAAIAFQDQAAGQRRLSALSEKDTIVYAALYNAKAQLFAEYGAFPEQHQPTAFSKTQEFKWFLDHAYVRLPILLEDEQVGTILVVSDLDDLYTQCWGMLLIGAMVIGIAALIGYLFSSKLQAWICNPILSLNEMTRHVTLWKDFSSRIPPAGKDEVGQLINSFNHMLKEISERDSALMLAKSKAEQADHVKSQFLANISHELRNPISEILKSTDDALSTKVSAEQLQTLKSIQSSGKSLYAVISDIIDFCHIEAGTLELNPTPIPLAFFTENLVEKFRTQAQQKNVSLAFHIDQHVPLALVADQSRLSQVLEHLLSNAIKYTEAGGLVNLSVDLRSREAYKCSFHFAVNDTGIGIAEDKLATIFDSFTQANTAPHRPGGLGLGLAITVRVVELMGGWIWAKSEVGKGSVFHFVIDCPIAEIDHVEKSTRA